jgi:hypothetical protein
MSVVGGSYGAGRSSSGSEYSENVFQPQAQALTGLYGQAGNLWGGQDFAPFMQMAQQLQPWMFQQAQAMQPALNQQASGGIRSPELERQLAQNMQAPSQMGQMYANIVGGPGNTYTDPLINSLRNDMQYTADRQIGTQNDLRAATLGQSGSAKHGVQNALTNRYANQDFQSQANQIRQQGYDTDLALKMGIAGQADTNRLKAADQAQNYMNNLNSNQQGAFGYAGNMQNLGMGAYAPLMQSMQFPWQMMNQYAGILGDPTVLGSGNSYSKSNYKEGSGSIF